MKNGQNAADIFINDTPHRETRIPLATFSKVKFLGMNENLKNSGKSTKSNQISDYGPVKRKY